MEPKILKNPLNKVFEFTYDGRVFIFQPGEVRAINGDAANLALEFNNTPLIDVTSTKNVVPTASGEVIEPKVVDESVPNLMSMRLPQLLKLAKENGIKTKFGMTREEVLTLILHGPKEN
jgi:hypothetical protein